MHKHELIAPLAEKSTCLAVSNKWVCMGFACWCCVLCFTAAGKLGSAPRTRLLSDDEGERGAAGLASRDQVKLSFAK